MSQSRSIVALAAGLAVVQPGCRAADPGAEGDPPMKNEPSTGDDLGTSSGGPPIVLGDQCDAAPVVGSGRFVGSLYNAASDFAGACGAGGPEVFVRVETDVRADVELSASGHGFVPRVGVLRSGCTADWASDGVACSRGLPTTVLDVAAGGTVVVAIGIDGDDPVLASAASDRDLAFALDVAFRGVVAVGDRCGLPGLGRCESGSACGLAQDGALRCAALDGDTCASAQPLTLALGVPTIATIDPTVPQTDAHAHSCVGARRPERVLELELPAELAEAASAATLTVATTAADVGLAVRGPGCLASDELACAAASSQGSTTTVVEIAARSAGARSVFVFVELPPSEVGDDLGGAGELAPFDVTFTLASRP